MRHYPAFINAPTWEDSRRILEQHPELLTPEADSIIRKQAEAQHDQGRKRVIEARRALLVRCRQMGIERAFAEQAQQMQESQGKAVIVPPEFDFPIILAQSLERRGRDDHQAVMELIQLYQQILRHLQPDEHPRFYAVIQVQLGNSN